MLCIWRGGVVRLTSPKQRPFSVRRERLVPLRRSSAPIMFQNCEDFTNSPMVAPWCVHLEARNNRTQVKVQFNKSTKNINPKKHPLTKYPTIIIIALRLIKPTAPPCLRLRPLRASSGDTAPMRPDEFTEKAFEAIQARQSSAYPKYLSFHSYSMISY